MQDNNKTHIENLKHKHAREIYQFNVESRRITEKLQDREHELRSVNLQVKYYQEMSKQQLNCVAELSKIIEDYRQIESDKNHADEIIFGHVQDRYSCKAVWDLADLSLGYFKELVIGKHGQSAYFIDSHRQRFNIFIKCMEKLGMRFENFDRKQHWDFSIGKLPLSFR